MQPRPHLNEAESEKVEGLELAKKKEKRKRRKCRVIEQRADCVCKCEKRQKSRK